MRHDPPEFADTVPLASPERARRSELHLAVLGGVVVALVVIAAWLAFAPAPKVPANDALAALRVQAQDGIGRSSAMPMAAAGPPKPSSVALQQVAAIALAPTSRPGFADVCGAGLLPASTPGMPELTPAWAQRAAAAAAGLAAELASASDPRRRAAGLLLQQGRAGRDAAEAEVDARQLRCGGDRACNEAAAREQVAARVRASAPTAEALATLAATSADPVVYAAALRACQSIGVMQEARAEACQLVSVAQWARLDPGNAVPWMYIATAASERRDGPGLDEAMHRVATATASRTYGELLSGLVLEATSDAADFEQSQRVVAAIGVGAAWPLPGYQTVTKYCDAAGLRDSNRLQTCDAVARGFIQHPSSLLEWQLGVRLGESLAWPAQELAPLRQRSLALRAAMQTAFSVAEPNSCEAVAKGRAFWLRIAREGELAATTALLR